MDKDIKKYAANHQLCIRLATQYMLDILERENKAEDLAAQIEPYRKKGNEQAGVTGSMWIAWFLHKRVPTVLEEE